MKKFLCGLCAVLSLVAVGSAAAAPTSVTVRVEGPTRTLIETRVTTDVRTFHFTGNATEHLCDSTVSGPPGASPAPTRNVALMVAGEQTGTAILGSFGEFGASFSSIGGESVGFDAGSGAYLAEYKNGSFADFGGCGDPIVDEDEVLYAYGTGSEPLLRLVGPSTARPGGTATVRVIDAGSSAPVAGASVGGATTGADGSASVAFGDRGPRVLKATKAGAIRSNALRVCVTDGADGACGTTVTTPPPDCVHSGDDGRCGTPDRTASSAVIRSVEEQQRFARGKGPRVLSGTVAADPSGVRDVSIRLSRSIGSRSFRFDARTERFVRQKRYGASGPYFSIGRDAAWSYQLPQRLGRGRYVLDVRATDGAGNADRRLARGRSRIVFHVR